MVRLDAAALGALEPGVRSGLDAHGTVDRYLTAVQDYLPGVLAGGAASDPTHAAVLRQLQPLTPQLLDGSQLYSVVEASRLLPCGCESVDALLSGGMRETTVTEIAGETCSGKTQLCHLAAVLCANRGERAVYFDATNAFSAARAQQLGDVDGQAAQAVLHNITVVRVHSIHALLSSLDELVQQASTMQPKLVVVDSISALLSPVVGAAQHSQGHVLVAEVARLLRHCAEALRCAVLVTNHVVGAGGRGQDEGGGGNRPGGVTWGFKPALGEQWRGAAHVRLQLSRSGGDVITATVLTHSLVAPGTQAHFRLGARIVPLQHQP